MLLLFTQFLAKYDEDDVVVSKWHKTNLLFTVWNKSESSCNIYCFNTFMCKIYNVSHQLSDDISQFCGDNCIYDVILEKKT